ncbi:MAG: divalent-cation tolerance protein CutA [Halothiobacillaceae bacterium]|jgi:periplasmic divalent cation tolerance protein
MTTHCIVISTFPDRATALAAARALLEARLVACAQISAPLTSIYPWQGTLQEDEECELRLKTRRALGPQIEAMLRKWHPYELPQILYVPMEGSSDYIDWVDSCLVS